MNDHKTHLPSIKILIEVVADTAKLFSHTTTYTGVLVGKDLLDSFELDSGIVKEVPLEVGNLALDRSLEFTTGLPGCVLTERSVITSGIYQTRQRGYFTTTSHKLCLYYVITTDQNFGTLGSDTEQ